MHKVVGFFGSVTVLPVLAQLEPSTLIGKLAVESAQFVLSVVVVAEAVAIYKMFRLWRADVEAARAIDKDRHDKMSEVLSANAVSQSQLSTTIQRHTEAIHRFANAVEKRDGSKREV